jgi:hypothetical protein
MQVASLTSKRPKKLRLTLATLNSRNRSKTPIASRYWNTLQPGCPTEATTHRCTMRTSTRFCPNQETIETPTSPDSVCFPPGHLIDHPRLTSDRSSDCSSTNGSDSTWISSSLLGPDGIPWWEDKETSQICHGSGPTPTVYSRSNGFTSVRTQTQKLDGNQFPRAAPTAASIHADLVAYLESMRFDRALIQTQTRRSLPYGNPRVTTDDKTILGEDETPVKSNQQKYRHRSSSRDHATTRSFSLVPDEGTKSRSDLSPPDRSRDRASCQKPKTRRRSLSNSRLMSGSSTGSTKIDRNPECKSLGTARGESNGSRRRCSFTLGQSR